MKPSLPKSISHTRKGPQQDPVETPPPPPSLVWRLWCPTPPELGHAIRFFSCLQKKKSVWLMLNDPRWSLGPLGFCLRDAHQANVDNSTSTLSSQTKTFSLKTQKRNSTMIWSVKNPHLTRMYNVSSAHIGQIFHTCVGLTSRTETTQMASDCFQAQLCFLV